MYKPNFEEFCKLADEGNLIPVYRDILSDIDTPVTAFKKIDSGKFSYLLESVEGGNKWGRYSFIGSEPRVIFKSKGRDVSITKDEKTNTFKAELTAIECFRELMNDYRPVNIPELPRFYGGAVGFFSYDTVRLFEDLPDDCNDDLETSDIFFMITDTVLIFDNINLKLKCLCNVRVDEFASLREAYSYGCSKVDGLVSKIKKPTRLSLVTASKENEGENSSKFRSNTSYERFVENVDKAKKYIKNGDIFQVVLSQRLECDLEIDPFTLYRTVRSINPSPYMFYLKLDDISLVGCSPEVMVRVEGEEVMVRPIAGTRPRGKDADEDDVLIKELLSDEKECAEHIMLVDLGRNDIGRISQYGTVKVDRLKLIEKYSHVIHIVSNVVGKLKEKHDAFDVLEACFPAGTLSGAPKIRAMEIIDELEVSRRGPYGGAVGYIGFSKNMDTCITIRTVLIKNGKAYVQAGAGIVADSDPKKEYKESLSKAEALLKAIVSANENSTQ